MKKSNIVFDSKGKPQGWLCDIYNSYNDILTLYCNYCKYCKRPEVLNEAALAIAVKRRGLLSMSDEKELYIKLFAQEKKLIADMDMPTLRARKEELRKIILEAKIRSAAVDETERERKAKLTQEQREWLVSNNGTDPLISDAIDSVEKRKKRMSKADKLNSDLSKLLGDDVASQLMKKVEQTQTSSSVNSSTSRNLTAKPVRTEENELTNHCIANRHTDCTGKFTDGTNRVCDCSCHSASVPVTNQTVTPKPNNGFSFSFNK